MLNIHKKQIKISFAFGLPYSKLFPVLDIKKSVSKLTRAAYKNCSARSWNTAIEQYLAQLRTTI
jgi:hypothetical protein